MQRCDNKYIMNYDIWFVKLVNRIFDNQIRLHKSAHNHLKSSSKNSFHTGCIVDNIWSTCWYRLFCDADKLYVAGVGVSSLVSHKTPIEMNQEKMSKHDRKLWKENNIKTLFLWVLYKETIVRNHKRNLILKIVFYFHIIM